MSNQDSDYFTPEEWSERCSDFADPGGRWALRAATHNTCPSCKKRVGEKDLYCRKCGAQLNPRIYPCPNCGELNMLTPKDIALHYQCDHCADQIERGY